MTTTETLTFQRLVEKYPHDVPPIEVARDILAYFAIDGEAADVLLPPLAYQVVTVQRNATRLIEAKIRKGERDAALGVDSDDVATLPEMRQAWINDRMYTGDCWVRVGDATVADHQSRIAFLQRKRAGIDTTIEFHQAAIAEIVAAGVTCLNEVPL
jgi:hypothetical protein